MALNRTSFVGSAKVGLVLMAGVLAAWSCSSTSNSGPTGSGGSTGPTGSGGSTVTGGGGSETRGSGGSSGAGGATNGVGGQAGLGSHPSHDQHHVRRAGHGRAVGGGGLDVQPAGLACAGAGDGLDGGAGKDLDAAGG